MISVWIKPPFTSWPGGFLQDVIITDIVYGYLLLSGRYHLVNQAGDNSLAGIC